VLSMDKMIREFEQKCNEEDVLFDSENQHVHCLAHIINLAAQDALRSLKWIGPENENEILNEDNDNEDATASMSVIKKLRKLVVKIRASPQRREIFRCQCVVLGLKELQLIPDVKTCWNSTFNMIKRALILKNCFQKATLEMSKSSYPTFGSSVPVYSYLIDNIEDFLDEKQCLDDIVAVANRAKDKIQKYYPTLDGLVYVNATVIDSRLKMEYYNDNETQEQIATNQPVNTSSPLANHMLKKSTNQPVNTSSPLANHMLKKCKFVCANELDTYLNSSSANLDIDILLFWKLHESEYPNLSKMAKDYLSIPVECIFSGGTDLISQRQCSLKPEAIRMCMCLKNW
ncbi:1087_t:CDS:2, partial [Entrophospora sp. SA101]